MSASSYQTYNSVKSLSQVNMWSRYASRKLTSPIFSTSVFLSCTAISRSFLSAICHSLAAAIYASPTNCMQPTGRNDQSDLLFRRLPSRTIIPARYLEDLRRWWSRHRNGSDDYECSLATGQIYRRSSGEEIAANAAANRPGCPGRILILKSRSLPATITAVDQNAGGCSLWCLYNPTRQIRLYKRVENCVEVRTKAYVHIRRSSTALP